MWFLRQRINVLCWRMPKRLDMNNTDRFLFVWLYRSFPLRLGSGCDCQIGDNRSIVSRRVRVYWRW